LRELKGHGVVPVKLEDRFDNLKEGSEEEKLQNSNLAIKLDDSGWVESLDEDDSLQSPDML
jgi:hypothetical protein